MSGAWLEFPFALVVGSVAVAVVPEAELWPVVTCVTLLVLLVAVAAAVSSRHKARAQRSEAHAQAMKEQIEVVRTAERDLFDVVLPQAMARVERGELPDVVLSSLAAPNGREAMIPAAHAAALRVVLKAVADRGASRDSTQQAVVALARRIQGSIAKILTYVRGLERQYAESPEVLEALYSIEHGVAQAGRVADSIAVLGGADPGTRWRRPVLLVEVMRGAIGRIATYQRVRLDSVVKVAVEGAAVEPLIHAMAELLDNATLYSPPSAPVRVSMSRVHNGVVVEFEDGGVGLEGERAEWAARALSGERALGLEELGETPRFGLAVVHLLTRPLGVSVTLRGSAYGGVTAVVMLPEEVLKTVEEEPARADAAEAPRPRTRPVAASASADDAVAALLNGTTRGGLPRRRAVPMDEPEGQVAAAAQAPPTPVDVDPAARGALFGSYQRASRAADAARSTPPPHGNATSPEVTP